MGPLGAVELPGRFISSFAVVGRNVFAALAGGLHRSEDYGASWIATTQPPGGRAIGKVFAHQGRLFATQQLMNSGQIYRSDDSGQTWSPIGDELGSSYVTSHAFWQGRLLVCVYHTSATGSFWSSTDFGDSWEQVHSLPTSANIYDSMAIAQDGRLAVGASAANSFGESIWLTDDLIAWDDYTGDLPSSARPFRNMVSHDGWFFKIGGGTLFGYRAPHPVATGLDEKEALPGELSIQVRPNPAPVGSTMRFALSPSIKVDWAIYDLNGRQVGALGQERIGTGTHEQLWTGEDDAGELLPAGIYFLRMQTPGQSQSAKIVLTP